MKNHLSNTLRGFVCGFAASALGSLLIALTLTLYDIPRSAALALPQWAALLFALALMMERLFARSSNLLVCVAGGCAMLLFFGEKIVAGSVFMPASSGFPVLLRILIWASGYVSCYAIYKLPSSDLFVRLSDALIVSITLYLAACFFLGDPLIMPILILAFLAMIACLLTAAFLRAGGESDRVIRGAGTGGLLLVLGILGVCLAAVSALISLVSGRINSVVDALLAVWSVCVRLISRVFEAFVRLIAFFAPKPVQYNMTLTQEESFMPAASGLEITAKMPRWAIILFIACLIALAIVVVILILWALRNTKLSRAPRRKARRVTRSSRMLEALLARIRALREALAFEAAYKKNRRTPQGLYILAVRRCRLTKLKKRPSESPSAFIRRLHAHLLSISGMSTLDALAGKLERVLYAGETVPLSHGESDAFAAQIQALHALSVKKPTP